TVGRVAGLRQSPSGERRPGGEETATRCHTRVRLRCESSASQVRRSVLRGPGRCALGYGNASTDSGHSLVPPAGWPSAAPYPLQDRHGDPAGLGISTERGSPCPPDARRPGDLLNPAPGKNPSPAVAPPPRGRGQRMAFNRLDAPLILGLEEVEVRVAT